MDWFLETLDISKAIVLISRNSVDSVDVCRAVFRSIALNHLRLKVRFIWNRSFCDIAGCYTIRMLGDQVHVIESL